MSITVSAYPTSLFSVLSSTISEIIALHNTQTTEIESGEYIHLDNGVIEKLCNKEFDTLIMDKDALLKTLEEHGATNIVECQGDISCECETFQLDFYKSKNEPYKVRITYHNENGVAELLSNLGNEYSTNAQEISYNKIKERLEYQNLEIEDEEVYEDNTIVLTINLE